MVIKTSSAKAKGRRLQQWVCKKISEFTRLPWGQDQPIESRAMGQPGPDVRLDNEAKKLFPFMVECKYQETWQIPAWIKQCRVNTLEKMDWLLFVKKNHISPIVIMDAETFFRLIKGEKNET